MKLIPQSSLNATIFWLACTLAVAGAAIQADARAQEPQSPPAQQREEAVAPTPATAQGSEGAIILRWKERRGVDRYRLQVARDARFRDILFDQAVLGVQYRVEGLTPGRYFWRVAPARGETGSFTRPQEVEVNAATTAEVFNPTEARPSVATADSPRDTETSVAANTASTVAGNPPATGRKPNTRRTNRPASAAEANTASSKMNATTHAVNVIIASNNTGWRTATGEISRPVLAPLRANRPPDLVGINQDGTTYALDSVRGYALWLARFNRRGEASTERPPKTFTPLVIQAGTSAHVIVPYPGGVRALRGLTGAEAWRVQLPAGTATHGVATDMDGDGKPEAVLIAGSPANLYVVDGQTGRIISQAGLDAGLIGAPAPFASGQVRGVALSLDNNTVDIRVVDGTSLRSRKLDTRITTAPLVVETSRGLLVTVGTEAGLDALDVKELQPLGRIVTENDVVQGTLSSIDLDGDNSAEVVMLTRRGRVAVVSTLDGKIKWFVEGANGAGVASFADLNSDGTLDVLVPAGQSFALGFSGHDGALIWRTEQERAATPGADAQTTRALAIAPVDAEASFLIGGEPSRTGLRAVELPKKAVVSRQ